MPGRIGPGMWIVVRGPCCGAHALCAIWLAMVMKDGLLCVAMPARAHRILLSVVFFCSGAIALMYEVIWHRQFALLFGSGAPATAIVLVASSGLAGSGVSTPR